MPAAGAPAATGVRVTACVVVHAVSASGSSVATRLAGGRVDSALLLLQLLIDLRLHAVDGAVLEDLAVDEDARRAAHVDLLPERELGVDLLLHLLRLPVGLELLQVESDLLGDALDRLGAEVTAVLVELVVHLP